MFTSVEFNILASVFNCKDPCLVQRKVTDYLTFGGELKLIFLLAFFFGHGELYE